MHFHLLFGLLVLFWQFIGLATSSTIFRMSRITPAASASEETDPFLLAFPEPPNSPPLSEHGDGAESQPPSNSIIDPALPPTEQDVVQPAPPPAANQNDVTFPPISELDYFSATSLLQSHYATETKHWNTPELFIDVATALDNDQPVTINIIDTFVEHEIRRSRKDKHSVSDPTSVYWLQSKYNQNTKEFRVETLSVPFVKSAQQAGFNLSMKGYEKKKNQLPFRCPRYEPYTPGARKPPSSKDTAHLPPSPSKRTARFKKGFRAQETSPRKTKTTKPVLSQADNVQSSESLGVEDVKCPFRFNIYWDQQRRRWWLPKKQSAVSHHCGHTEQTPDQIRIRTNKLGQEQLQRIKNCVETFVGCATIADLTRLESGMDIEYSQLHNLRRKVREQHYLSVVPGMEAAGPSTSADRLLANLENDPETSYIVLYGSYESNLLTVYKKVKSTTLQSEITAVDHDSLVDDVDSVQSQADKLKSSLSISGTGLVLLAVAWTNDAARRRFEMFPDYCGFDCTGSTNAEGRPLMQAVAIDSNFKNIPHTWAFLPSQSRWVFDWFFGTAMLALHQRTTLNRIRIMRTDQDDKEYGAIDSLREGGKLYTSALHALCAFHKNNRGFSTDSTFKNKVSKLEKETDKVEFDVIVDWLWRLTTYPETEQESDVMVSLLEQYLEEDETRHAGQLGEPFRQEIKDWFTKSWKPVKDKLLAHKYAKSPLNEVVTTNRNEVENRSAKYSSGGVQPNNELDESQKRLNNISSRRNRRHERSHVIGLSQSFTLDRHREQFVRGVVDYGAQSASKQYECRKDYVFWRSSFNNFLVKLKYDKEGFQAPRKKGKAKKKGPRDTKKRSDWVIPKFERTRIVSIHIHDGKMVMSCTCKEYFHLEHMCRHMYAVLDRAPKLHDFSCKYWKLYMTKFGTAPKYTNVLRHIRDELSPQGFFVEREEVNQWPVGHGAEDRDFLLRSLDNLQLKKDNYWTKTPEQREATLNFLSLKAVGHEEAGLPNIGVSLTQEVSLSQAVLSQVQSQAELEDQDPVFRSQDDVTEGGMIEYPMNEDDSVEGGQTEEEHRPMDAVEEEVEVDITQQYEGNFYSDLLPLYQQATRAGWSIQDFQELKDSLHSFTTRALERTSQRVGTAPPSGMGSFASLDRRNRDTRLSANSPTRKRKRS